MGKPYSSIRDYKPVPASRRRPPLIRKQGRWLLTGIGGGIALVLVLANGQGEATVTPPATVDAALASPPPTGEDAPARTRLVRMPLPLPQGGAAQERAATRPSPVHVPRPPAAAPENRLSGSVATQAAAPETDPADWRTIRVARGENLSLIFSRLGLPAADLQAILDLGQPAKRLKRLYPGDELRVLPGRDGRLEALRYRYDDEHSLSIERHDKGFVARTIDHPIERRRHFAQASIDDSLFLAAQRAGLSDRLTMELAGIFGWDIDFALDIRKGDSFAVVYEGLYQNGERLRDGEILAASFTNRGRTYRAVRFDDGHYYAPDGRSMRKAFLRTPVRFTRISSRFSLGRKHPILHHIRAHHGVDYAAPSGTPIKATGDGKVAFIGRKGGYGRVIVLKHGSRYSTVYAHLSRYRKGLRKGSRVRQGQIIGYVGMSGLATGPHLHYEFRVNGVHRNPLTVRLPDAAPLDHRLMARFRERAEPLLAQLDLLQSSTRLARR